MNLLKYFKFYYKLTEHKLLNVILLSMLSSLCQSVALAAIATIANRSGASGKSNVIVNLVEHTLTALNFTESNQIFAVLLFAVASAFAATSFFLLFTNVYIVKLQNEIYRKMVNRVMELFITAKYEYYVANSVGYFHNNVIRQLRTVASSFKLFASVITLSVQLIPFVLISLMANFTLVIILGVVLSLLVLPLYFINKKTKALSIQNVTEFTTITSIMIQILHHYKYLKATDGHRSVFGHLRDVVKRLNSIGVKLIILANLSSNVMLSFAIFIICGLVYWQVVYKGVSLMDAGFVLGMLYMAATRLNAIPVALQKFMSSAGSILTYEEFVNDLNKYHEKDKEKHHINADFNKSLLFEKVSFQYKDADTMALNDICFEIKPYTSVAFVGGSGSGKSTIVNIVSGLLFPTEGTLKLGEALYNDISLHSLRSNIGYVTQEPVIFTDNVFNNIALWDDKCSKEDVINAAKAARAHEFIMNLPEQYNSMLGDNGVNLSGGQRQRISIAREFLRNTPLLILDEATSALDSETELDIQQSINELHGKKTMIIIAHRLSTIKHCDMIYVLDEGQIVEQGAYDELIKENGLFKKMVDKQSL
jgi:subfamily B ATP-binding cassette protein MsbA